MRSWDERVGRFPGEGTVSGNFREAEAREITGIDNGAHAGRGVVNQSRRLLQTQHFTVVGVRNSKYAEGLLWARQLLQVNQ